MKRSVFVVAALIALNSVASAQIPEPALVPGDSGPSNFASSTPCETQKLLAQQDNEALFHRLYWDRKVAIGACEIFFSIPSGEVITTSNGVVLSRGPFSYKEVRQAKDVFRSALAACGCSKI